MDVPLLELRLVWNMHLRPAVPPMQSSPASCAAAQEAKILNDASET